MCSTWWSPVRRSVRRSGTSPSTCAGLDMTSSQRWTTPSSPWCERLGYDSAGSHATQVTKEPAELLLLLGIGSYDSASVATAAGCHQLMRSHPQSQPAFGELHSTRATRERDRD